MIGHAGGLPVEEALPLLSSLGAALFLARTWLAGRRQASSSSSTAPSVSAHHAHP